jgi:hypothetical protein
MPAKRSKSTFADAGMRIPAQVRTFASTLAGNRDPITEKNFTKAELQQMRSAIERSKKRGSQKSTVDYADYGDDSKRQQMAFKDFSVLPKDAARNTLGRFKYEKTPEGRLVAIDNYDFKDDLTDKLPNIPKSKDYEKLNAIQKAVKLAKDTFNPEMGGFGTLPSRVGSAYIGDTKRPVRIDLGEAPFKKGGSVKAKSKVTRGDGICKKGHTKGKMV